MQRFFQVILFVGVTLLGVLLAQDGPESVLRGTKQFAKRVVVAGLAGPWELTWGPDNRLWVTERTGKRVTRIDPATGERSVAITIDEVTAPGAQDGLLGMALHPELLRGTGNDYVYVVYTYIDQSKAPHLTVANPNSPYRFLYTKIVRFSYSVISGTLSDPVNVITGMPAGNDHQSGRLKFGPDGKLYYTIGDQGNNQLGNYCIPTEAQRLPTAAEMAENDYVAYVGKSLRLNLDGSIPNDNPNLNGVVSHIFTYGHRNPQGIDFGPDGTLYSSEQGPKSDDEINILTPGGNYGWPNVAGFADGNAYEYAHWSESSTPCAQLRFSDIVIPDSVPREPESAFAEPFTPPMATMFTVPSSYNFRDPACRGVDFICWPTVGASNVEYYSKPGVIPGWDKVLLITTLKRGSLYVLPLASNGQTPAGKFSRYFQSENRFRDTAVSPDGLTIYIATDPDGQAEALNGATTRTMQDKGAILAFTYEGEGGDAPKQDTETKVTVAPPVTATLTGGVGAPPRFTAAQAASGKTAFDANCAACHGNTLTNGTFAPPLAGETFKDGWSSKSVRALYDKASAMPPAAPGSLPAPTYADIVAYILQVNGFNAGDVPLPAGGTALDGMSLR